MKAPSRTSTGTITFIAGPVVGAVGLKGVRLYDVVRVGEMGLIGEIIRISREAVTLQVYEDTSGVRIGELVHSTGQPLVATLGPGLLGQVYDGLQRPLYSLADLTGDFIHRGVSAPPIPETDHWHFIPALAVGDRVEPGTVLGRVRESRTIEHQIQCPIGIRGQVVDICEGEFTLHQTTVKLETPTNGRKELVELPLAQQWPVRLPRPVHTRLPPKEPLITGTRVIDAFFPVAKGGTAIIPGGFGTGKTVAEHSLARWADADVVVYIGCGERGNEMTEVLEEFPSLEDPHTGAPLMERTILIANTSNMPVAAREASIYTGITIAEYYRDMGYDVLVLADSTSRWGEALREISGRLEEMPGEEGYPAYLAARLAEFYERSGRVIPLGGRRGSSNRQRTGSVTIVGAVSPPGADFSEPMTQNSMRVVGTFWALDYDLSRRRHFPAINWIRSFSLYDFREWFSSRVSADWATLTGDAMALLQREVELLEIVRLVGPDALAESERAILAVTRMLREDFLQQSAYHKVDRFCPIDKAYLILNAILDFHHRAQAALGRGVPLEKITGLPVVGEIGRLKEQTGERVQETATTLLDHIPSSIDALRGD